MLIKEKLALRFLPESLVSGKTYELPSEMKRRIRLIPITRDGGVKILIGIRPDIVRIICKGGKAEEIDLIIAIDKEGGTYGGYEALLPASAIEDVI